MDEDFSALGFRYPKDLIFTFIGGSQLHGAKLEGSDDTDWYGVYIEPPNVVLGIDADEHFVHTTGGQRGGNGPGDVDVVLYSLRKWAKLAAKGNPSVLHFLYAPAAYQTIVWSRLALQREAFLAKTHVRQFLGFASAQLRRLFNQQGQKNVHRGELEEKFGYDTKYAMHVVRLFGEAKEFLETGVISLPRPNRDELISIRRGEWPLTKFQEYANALEAQTLSAEKTSPLPERVDRQAVSKIISAAYEQHWDLVRAVAIEEK